MERLKRGEGETGIQRVKAEDVGEGGIDRWKERGKARLRETDRWKAKERESLNAYASAPSAQNQYTYKSRAM